MVFDSISKALAYLKDSWSLLTNSKAVLSQRLTEIDSLLSMAKKTNDQTAISRLIMLKAQTLDSLRQSDELWAKINPFRQYLSGPPILGVIPFALLAGGIGLASALYVYLQKVKNEGEALDLVKKGVITAAQAQGLVGGGFAAVTGNIGTIVMWGAIAFGLFLVMPMLKGRST